MPLHPGTGQGVISKNISEMVANGHSHASAVAASMKESRQPLANGGVVRGYAFGGGTFNGTKPIEQPQSYMPPYVRSEMRQGMHSGMIASQVAGRTDHLPISVKQGAYVFPADFVSGMGQGNSAAGGQILDRMFKSGPYGVGLQSQHMGSLMRPPPAPRAAPMPGMPKFADGGAVPIKAAGGEYVLDPEHVSAIGGGDLNHGHEILDHWVTSRRKENIKELKSLPGPAK